MPPTATAASPSGRTSTHQHQTTRTRAGARVVRHQTTTTTERRQPRRVRCLRRSWGFASDDVASSRIARFLMVVDLGQIVLLACLWWLSNHVFKVLLFLAAIAFALDVALDHFSRRGRVNDFRRKEREAVEGLLTVRCLLFFVIPSMVWLWCLCNPEMTFPPMTLDENSQPSEFSEAYVDKSSRTWSDRIQRYDYWYNGKLAVETPEWANKMRRDREAQEGGAKERPPVPRLDQMILETTKSKKGPYLIANGWGVFLLYTAILMINAAILIMFTAVFKVWGELYEDDDEVETPTLETFHEKLTKTRAKIGGSLRDHERVMLWNLESRTEAFLEWLFTSMYGVEQKCLESARVFFANFLGKVPITDNYFGYLCIFGSQLGGRLPQPHLTAGVPLDYARDYKDLDFILTYIAFCQASYGRDAMHDGLTKWQKRWTADEASHGLHSMPKQEVLRRAALGEVAGYRKVLEMREERLVRQARFSVTAGDGYAKTKASTKRWSAYHEKTQGFWCCELRGIYAQALLKCQQCQLQKARAEIEAVVERRRAEQQRVVSGGPSSFLAEGGGSFAGGTRTPPDGGTGGTPVSFSEGAAGRGGFAAGSSGGFSLLGGGSTKGGSSFANNRSPASSTTVSFSEQQPTPVTARKPGTLPLATPGSTSSSLAYSAATSPEAADHHGGPPVPSSSDHPPTSDGQGASGGSITPLRSSDGETGTTPRVTTSARESCATATALTPERSEQEGVVVGAARSEDVPSSSVEVEEPLPEPRVNLARARWQAAFLSIAHFSRELREQNRRQLEIEHRLAPHMGNFLKVHVTYLPKNEHAGRPRRRLSARGEKNARLPVQERARDSIISTYSEQAQHALVEGPLSRDQSRSSSRSSTQSFGFEASRRYSCSTVRSGGGRLSGRGSGAAAARLTEEEGAASDDQAPRVFRSWDEDEFSDENSEQESPEYHESSIGVEFAQHEHSDDLVFPLRVVKVNSGYLVRRGLRPGMALLRVNGVLVHHIGREPRRISEFLTEEECSRMIGMVGDGTLVWGAGGGGGEEEDVGHCKKDRGRLVRGNREEQHRRRSVASYGSSEESREGSRSSDSSRGGSSLLGPAWSPPKGGSTSPFSISDLPWAATTYEVKKSDIGGK